MNNKGTNLTTDWSVSLLLEYGIRLGFLMTWLTCTCIHMKWEHANFHTHVFKKFWLINIAMVLCHYILFWYYVFCIMFLFYRRLCFVTVLPSCCWPSQISLHEQHIRCETCSLLFFLPFHYYPNGRWGNGVFHRVLGTACERRDPILSFCCL